MKIMALGQCFGGYSEHDCIGSNVGRVQRGKLIRTTRTLARKTAYVVAVPLGKLISVQSSFNKLVLNNSIKH